MVRILFFKCFHIYIYYSFFVLVFNGYLDIFVNTKMDEGPCQKVHSEPIKAEFQKSRDIYMYDNLIEREFQNRIAEADRVIKVMVSNLFLLLYSC